MKVTIKTASGNLVSVNVDSSFQLWVDEEMLLEHTGPSYLNIAKKYSEKCESFDKQIQKSSSLFSACPSFKKFSEEPEHIHFDVPNSSFIDSIRWWAVEESIGSDALEINFKDGRYVTYQHVPKSVITNWIAAIKTGLSAGRYYNQNIKGSYEIYNEGDNTDVN